MIRRVILTTGVLTTLATAACVKTSADINGDAVISDNGVMQSKSPAAISGYMCYSLVAVDGQEPHRERILVPLDMYPGVEVKPGEHTFQITTSPSFTPRGATPKRFELRSRVESRKRYILMADESAPYLKEDRPR
jgi:hypothetical protein